MNVNKIKKENNSIKFLIHQTMQMKQNVDYKLLGIFIAKYTLNFLMKLMIIKK